MTHARIGLGKITLCLGGVDVHFKSLDEAELACRALSRALREYSRLSGTEELRQGGIVVSPMPKMRISGPNLDADDVEGPIGSDLRFPEGT